MNTRKTPPNKKLQEAATKESINRSNSENKGRQALRNASAFKKLEIPGVRRDTTKTPTEKLRGIVKLANERTDIKKTQRAARAPLPKRASLATERLSSPMQSKDFKTDFKTTLPRGTSLKAGPIGAAATAITIGVNKYQESVAKKIARDGVGGSDNMARINKFRSKTPSKAYTEARKKLK